MSDLRIHIPSNPRYPLCTNLHFRLLHSPIFFTIFPAVKLSKHAIFPKIWIVLNSVLDQNRIYSLNPDINYTRFWYKKKKKSHCVVVKSKKSQRNFVYTCTCTLDHHPRHGQRAKSMPKTVVNCASWSILCFVILFHNDTNFQDIYIYTICDSKIYKWIVYEDNKHVFVYILSIFRNFSWYRSAE